MELQKSPTRGAQSSRTPRWPHLFSPAIWTGATTPKPSRKTATFVLVHGAWHGGWCWQRVVHRLQARGHRVYAPTLTGVCERSHLDSPASI